MAQPKEPIIIIDSQEEEEEELILEVEAQLEVDREEQRYIEEGDDAESKGGLIN